MLLDSWSPTRNQHIALIYKLWLILKYLSKPWYPMFQLAQSWNSLRANLRHNFFTCLCQSSKFTSRRSPYEWELSIMNGRATVDTLQAWILVEQMSESWVSLHEESAWGQPRGQDPGDKGYVYLWGGPPSLDFPLSIECIILYAHYAQNCGAFKQLTLQGSSNHFWPL